MQFLECNKLPYNTDDQKDTSKLHLEWRYPAHRYTDWGCSTAEWVVVAVAPVVAAVAGYTVAPVVVVAEHTAVTEPVPD